MATSFASSSSGGSGVNFFYPPSSRSGAASTATPNNPLLETIKLVWEIAYYKLGKMVGSPPKILFKPLSYKLGEMVGSPQKILFKPSRIILRGQKIKEVEEGVIFSLHVARKMHDAVFGRRKDKKFNQFSMEPLSDELLKQRIQGIALYLIELLIDGKPLYTVLSDRSYVICDDGPGSARQVKDVSLLSDFLYRAGFPAVSSAQIGFSQITLTSAETAFYQQIIQTLHVIRNAHFEWVSLSDADERPLGNAGNIKVKLANLDLPVDPLGKIFTKEIIDLIVKIFKINSVNGDDDLVKAICKAIGRYLCELTLDGLYPKCFWPFYSWLRTKGFYEKESLKFRLRISENPMVWLDPSELFEVFIGINSLSLTCEEDLVTSSIVLQQGHVEQMEKRKPQTRASTTQPSAKSTASSAPAKSQQSKESEKKASSAQATASMTQTSARSTASSALANDQQSEEARKKANSAQPAASTTPPSTSSAPANAQPPAQTPASQPQPETLEDWNNVLKEILSLTGSHDSLTGAATNSSPVPIPSNTSTSNAHNSPFSLGTDSSSRSQTSTSAGTATSSSHPSATSNASVSAGRSITSNTAASMLSDSKRGHKAELKGLDPKKISGSAGTSSNQPTVRCANTDNNPPKDSTTDGLPQRGRSREMGRENLPNTQRSKSVAAGYASPTVSSAGKTKGKPSLSPSRYTKKKP